MKPLLNALTWCALAAGVAQAGERAHLNPHLEPLRPLLGKAWKDTFRNSTREKPVVDASRWERALNGRGVRMLHSINQGVFGA